MSYGSAVGPGKNEDAFIKSVQDKRAKMAGGEPSPLPAEAKKFNQYMCNDGEHAKSLAGKLFKNIDDAFPVNK